MAENIYYYYFPEDIETRKHNLNHKNAVALNFISTNGPNPLVSLPLVSDFLTEQKAMDIV